MMIIIYNSLYINRPLFAARGVLDVPCSGLTELDVIEEFPLKKGKELKGKNMKKRFNLNTVSLQTYTTLNLEANTSLMERLKGGWYKEGDI